MKVTITRAEIENEPAPWPGATPEHRLAAIMKRKGLELRWSIDPKPTDLVAPWFIEQFIHTGDIVVIQGEDVHAHH